MKIKNLKHIACRLLTILAIWAVSLQAGAQTVTPLPADGPLTINPFHGPNFSACKP